MIGVGFLVFSLISQSEHGKADARAGGLASTAASVYQSRSADARADAAAIARAVSSVPTRELSLRVRAVAAQAGLARVTVSVGPRRILDCGDRSAVAPGTATIRNHPGGPVVITTSELTAAQYAREVTAPGDATIVRQGSSRLASAGAKPAPRSPPARGSVSIGDSDYRAVTQGFRGFGPAPVNVTVLSNLAATSGSAGTSRALAAGFIVAFLLLAFAFWCSLRERSRHSWRAFWRRPGGSARATSPRVCPPRETTSSRRLATSSTRWRMSSRTGSTSSPTSAPACVSRSIGQTFASNLDRPALLELALRTAVDAGQAGSGRLSARSTADDPLSEWARVGSLSGFQEQVLEAERAALSDSGLGEVHGDDVSVASVALGAFEDTDRSHGLITVTRRGPRFSVDERDLLRSLASEATLALENVELHR
jgi:hypothetical protein